jgi:hypothetical protein
MSKLTPAPTSYGPSKHGDDCSCTRCHGFAPRNTVALRHGAYSSRALSKRAAALEPTLRFDFAGAADELLLHAVAEAAGQVELGLGALAAVGAAPAARLERVRLSEDTRGWISTLLKLLDRAGGTPAARSEMAARLVRAGAELRLDPDERDELRRLEGMTKHADILTLESIKDRARLRDLREQATGR